MSATGLPVKVTTVFPLEPALPAEAVVLDPKVVLALPVAAEAVLWLLHDDLGHSARALMDLVMDLAI
jgi:hypothetical protein